MDHVIYIMRFAVRSLLRRRGVTAIAVLMLALGIGVNTTTYTAVTAIVFHPLPREVEEPGRLVQLSELAPNGERNPAISVAALADWEGTSRTLLGVAAYRWWQVNVTGIDDAEQVYGYQVSANFFDVLASRPALGRTFRPGEDAESAARVVVLSHGFWRARLGGASAVIGRTIRLNGVSHIIVGVMPNDWAFPAGTALWAPLATSPAAAADRSQRSLIGFGRLRSGAGMVAATAEATTFGAALARDWPASNAGWGAYTEPLEFAVSRGPRPYMLLTLAGVWFVALIVCVNVANLLLMQAASRSREIAVHVALGAPRSRLVGQLLAESLLIALAGGMLGLGLAAWGTRLFWLTVPPDLRPFVTGSVFDATDRLVIAYNLVLSLTCGILFSLAPIRHALRVDIQAVLKQGGAGTGRGPKHHRLRRTLVIAETALAMVCLVSAGLMVRSFQRLAQADLGFAPARVLTMRLALPELRYASDTAISAFYRNLLDGVRAVPEVQEAAVTSVLPMSWAESVRPVSIEGRPVARPGAEPVVPLRLVSQTYFAAMGIGLVKGRTFGDGDDDAHPGVAVVSRSVAERLWPAEEAVGARVRVGTASRPVEIVGVVADVQHNTLVSRDPTAALYLPIAQTPVSRTWLVARTRAEPAAATAGVRRALASLDESLAPLDVTPIERVVANGRSPYRVTAQLMGVFAVLALFLAAIGLFGVIATSVTERTREIGVRTALGAQQRDLVRLVIRDALRLSGVGLALGTVAAMLVSLLARSILYDVGGLDPVTYAVSSIALALAALAAGWIPAVRAARLDPLLALRGD